MPHNDAPEGCLILALLLSIGIPLAWVCFLAWVIYTLVTWLVSK